MSVDGLPEHRHLQIYAHRDIVEAAESLNGETLLAVIIGITRRQPGQEIEPPRNRLTDLRVLKQLDIVHAARVSPGAEWWPPRLPNPA